MGFYILKGLFILAVFTSGVILGMTTTFGYCDNNKIDKQDSDLTNGSKNIKKGRD